MEEFREDHNFQWCHLLTCVHACVHLFPLPELSCVLQKSFCFSALSNAEAAIILQRLDLRGCPLSGSLTEQLKSMIGGQLGDKKKDI